MRCAVSALTMLVLPLAAGAATHTVTMEGMQFRPASLTVKRGDKVVWRNRDIVPHTATVPGKFDSKGIAGGASWTWKAVTRGRYDYVCTYHPGMKATLTVE